MLYGPHLCFWQTQPKCAKSIPIQEFYSETITTPMNTYWLYAPSFSVNFFVFIKTCFLLTLRPLTLYWSEYTWQPPFGWGVERRGGTRGSSGRGTTKKSTYLPSPALHYHNFWNKSVAVYRVLLYSLHCAVVQSTECFLYTLQSA